MKYFRWFKENVNLISFVVGIGFVIAGKEDVGRLIMSSGGAQ